MRDYRGWEDKVNKKLINDLKGALVEIQECSSIYSEKDATHYLSMEFAPLLDTLMSDELSSVRGRGHQLRETFSLDLAKSHFRAIIRRLEMRPVRATSTRVLSDAALESRRLPRRFTTADSWRR